MISTLPIIDYSKSAPNSRPYDVCMLTRSQSRQLGQHQYQTHPLTSPFNPFRNHQSSSSQNLGNPSVVTPPVSTHRNPCPQNQNSSPWIGTPTQLRTTAPPPTRLPSSTSTTTNTPSINPKTKKRGRRRSRRYSVPEATSFLTPESDPERLTIQNQLENHLQSAQDPLTRALLNVVIYHITKPESLPFELFGLARFYPAQGPIKFYLHFYSDDNPRIATIKSPR